jgi:hypothetical protein
VKRESEREREKRKSKKQQKKQQTKKKKKERTRVIFDVKAFFSIFKEAEKRVNCSRRHRNTTQNKNKSSSNLTYINNVCGWD